MGGKTSHIVKCDKCGEVVKELIFDKRDMKLKCMDCYKNYLIKKDFEENGVF